MSLSAFNLYVDDFPGPGQTLVHNTFSGAFVVLAAEDLEVLRKHDRGEPLTGAERAVVDDPDLRDRDVGIVVDSPAAEQAEYRAWFERRRGDTARLQAIVGINLACNFDCTYCCQAEVMDGTVMSWETVDHTARFLADRAERSGAEQLHLIFVGGEPLLHPDRCIAVVERVRERAPQLSITIGLITNGYFLDEAMVERLLPHGLVNAQITLDGDEHTHHLTRVSKKGENTFQRIFDNLIAASRRIRISLNGNYQNETIAGFGPLLDKLAAAGFAPGQRVHFSPALDALSSVAGAGVGSCTWSGADTYQVALHDAIVKHGWDTAPLNTVGPCAFHDVNNFSIEPDGTLYKCPGFLGHPDWNIGHVASGLSPRYGELLGVDTQSSCGSCSHRPNCAGGCVANVWIRSGQAEGTNCEHDYFEDVKRDALVREYLLATSDDREHALASFPRPARTLPPHPQAERGIRPAALRVVSA